MFMAFRIPGATNRYFFPAPALRRHVRRMVLFPGPGTFLCAAVSLSLLLAPPAVPAPSALLKSLASIHAEVKELGARPGQSFISWDFFIGSEDDDDTNKDRHVAVIIQDVAGRERMTIVVTRMEVVGGNPGIRAAAGSKTLSCDVEDGLPAILRSDFGDEEAAPVAIEILKAVRNKKRLLRS